MRILLFGGTTEGRLLAEKLNEAGHDVTVSVATKLGAEELPDACARVLAGRLEKDGMAQLARGYDLVIDATHPYAQLASANIREACEETGVPLRRVLREGSDKDGCVVARDHAEASAYLAEHPGNVLLTTGSKELGAYRALEKERLFARVLPTHEALDACERLGIPHRNILAMQGPFSLDMNLAAIRQYAIRYLVTKDGGTAGGFPEKREAAKQAGICMIVIGRPQDSGVTMEELLKELEGKS